MNSSLSNGDVRLEFNVNNHLLNKVSSDQWETLLPSLLHQTHYPCPRSLHAAAVWNDIILIFGGFDGQRRLNDLYSFNTKTGLWQDHVSNQPPSPRDRHSAVVWGNSFYCFAGFDGVSRCNDLYELNLLTQNWRLIVAKGSTPSLRHSHSAVVYKNCMYVVFGYDGNYCDDIYQFNFFSQIWTRLVTQGILRPKGRYRCVACVHNDSLIIHGGHDGSTHLDDTWMLSFETFTWSQLETIGTSPCARDSHCAVIFRNSLFVFGGSHGGPLDDFHELNLISNTWRLVSGSTATSVVNENSQQSPGPQSPGFSKMSYASRMLSSNITVTQFNDSSSSATFFLPIHESSKRFCHTGVLHDSYIYCFGGYDGQSRLSSLIRYQLQSDIEPPSIIIPQSSLQEDLKSFINNDSVSDVSVIRILGS